MLIVRNVKSMNERQRLKIQIFVVQRLEEEYREKSDNKISKMMEKLGNVRQNCAISPSLSLIWSVNCMSKKRS